MGYYFCDTPKPEEDVVIAYCSECKGEIYAGKEYTTDGERVLCSKCIEAELMALPLWEKAQLMGYETRSDALCRR